MKCHQVVEIMGTISNFFCKVSVHPFKMGNLIICAAI